MAILAFVEELSAPRELTDEPMMLEVSPTVVKEVTTFLPLSSTEFVWS